MSILFTFPGQGAQYPGMLHQLPDDQQTRELLQQACDELKQNVLQLDTPEALSSTYAVQLAILISGVVYGHQLINHGIVPNMVCGLSIGAFPAAVIAGALTFADALNMVALRAQLMTEAYPTGYGLAAIIGLTYPELAKLIEDIFTQQAPLYIANINTEKQLVVAGENEALKKIMQLAQQHGATKTTKLQVSVPSHCILLEPAANQLANELQKVTLQTPIYRFLSSNQARVISQPEKISQDLAFNMARTVHLATTMQAAQERGISLAIELPPGAVLTGLCHQNISTVTALSLQGSGLNSILYKSKQYLSVD